MMDVTHYKEITEDLWNFHIDIVNQSLYPSLLSLEKGLPVPAALANKKVNTVCHSGSLFGAAN